MDRKFLDRRVEHYRKKRDENMKGIKNNIVFHNFHSINRAVPGIIPGFMYKITSHSGMGKTQLAKALFVFSTIESAIKYKLAYNIVYVALEESKEEFIDTYLLYLVYMTHGTIIERFKLEGFGDQPLSQDEIDKIDSCREMLAERLAYIYIIDDQYKPTGIYKKIRAIGEKYGEYITYVNEDGDKVEGYFPTKPFHKFLVICDHISLIESEYDEDTKTQLTESKSIAKWHTRICRKLITKQWKWSVLNIQQQSLESEKQQFTSKGESIIDKVLPTLDGVANNREVIRDDYIVLGLFAPDRYNILKFRGYVIAQEPGVQGNQLKDNFRSLHVLKNRFGPANGVLPLFFMGQCNFFSELPIPIPANEVELDKFYNYSLLLRNVQTKQP